MCKGKTEMAFEESQQRQDKQTRLDAAIQTEKERRIKEYQRPFLVALGIIPEGAGPAR